MDDAFRHLHMPPELACEFLGVFSRLEYALKATIYGTENEGRVEACWDRFANDIDEAFRQIAHDEFKAAVDYLLGQPPRKQVRREGALTFQEQTVDKNQTIAQQILLMVRTVRNNLFHGGKYLPVGEIETGRNEVLVSHSLEVLRRCIYLNEAVRQSCEQ